MKRANSLHRATPFFGMALLLAAPAWALAQDQTPATKEESAALLKVRSIFSAADADKDGRIAPLEAAHNGIRGRDFATYDHDADRSWTSSEFLLYYRSLLTRAGHKIDKDLQAEANRILAERKAAEEAKAAAEAAKLAAAAKAASAAPAAPADGAAGSPDPVAVAGGAAAAPASGEPAAADSTGAAGTQAPETLREKHEAAQEQLAERFANAENADPEQARAASQALLERAQNAQQVNQQAAGETAGEGPAAASVASVPVTPQATIQSGAALPVAGAEGDSSAHALTRDEAAQQLERSIVILKRLIEQKRLTPRQARDFYQLFKDRATQLVEGVEPSEGGEAAAQSGAAGQPDGARQADPKILREALANATRRLIVLHLAGAVSAEEARAMQKQLEQRAIAALAEQGDILDEAQLQEIRRKAATAPETPVAEPEKTAPGRPDPAADDAKGKRERTKPQPEKQRQPAGEEGTGKQGAGSEARRVEAQPKQVTRGTRQPAEGDKSADKRDDKSGGAKPAGGKESDGKESGVRPASAKKGDGAEPAGGGKSGGQQRPARERGAAKPKGSGRGN